MGGIQEKIISLDLEKVKEIQIIDSGEIENGLLDQYLTGVGFLKEKCGELSS